MKRSSRAGGPDLRSTPDCSSLFHQPLIVPNVREELQIPRASSAAPADGSG